ncbi:WD repeat-containing protein 62 [Camelus dromedarius]|uniref:WD repeat-containing protein 62 n=1 Tax=Camelus dromedarius TaxID=9838 RepID=A0A5N4DPX9_CAMDR|nr:WD repeat-containing protein 62 [Camelus dromedarius]
MVEGRRELLSEEVERGARDQQDDSYLRVPSTSFKDQSPPEVLSGEKVEDPLETLEAQSPLSEYQLESGGVFLILPLHPQMHHLDQGCPGHCGETRAPAGVLPPDPLELSNVGTVVHRLQAPSKKPWTFTTWWAPLQMVSSDEVSAERQQARTELASTFLWIHSQLEANDWLVGTDVASARPSQPGYPLPTHTVPPSQPRFACPAGTLLGAAGAGCAEEARGD